MMSDIRVLSVYCQFVTKGKEVVLALRHLCDGWVWKRIQLLVFSEQPLENGLWCWHIQKEVEVYMSTCN